MTRLYTFWVSHFSEKARWALDFEGIEYEHRPLLPGPHVFEIRKYSKKQSVPLLLHNTEVVHGSGAIIDAIPRLFGRYALQPWLRQGASNETLVVDETLKSRAVELEALADESFGRGIQAVAYTILLKHKPDMIALWNYRGPWWGTAFYALAFPGIKKFVQKTYCGDSARVERLHRAFVKGFDELDPLLERQAYLLGPSPTRVDLAVAGLLAPLVQPKEHPMKCPPLPEELLEFTRSFEDRPTWKFVKRLYRDHRGTKDYG